MSAETLQQYKQRQDSAKKAAEARWAKQKQELDSALEQDRGAEARERPRPIEGPARQCPQDLAHLEREGKDCRTSVGK
jgi:hypothetical protein